MQDVDRRRRGAISPMTYVRAACRAVQSYEPPKLVVELDGRALSGRYGFVVVANVFNYGGIFRLCRNRHLDDGLFEVYLFRDARVPALAAAGVRSVIGTAGPLGCEVRQARSVRVRSKAPAPCQVDGDAAGFTPLEFAVRPEQYTVLVP